MIIDVIVLVVACVVLLGLAWLTEEAVDWIWGRIFGVFKFLFKTSLGMGLLVFVVVFVSLLILNGLFSPDPILEAAQQAQGQVEPARQFPTWLQIVIYCVAGGTGIFLLISGYRRLTGSNSEEEVVWRSDPGPEIEEEDPNEFPWGRFILVVGGFTLLTTVSVVLGVGYTVGAPTAEWPGYTGDVYMWLTAATALVSAFLGFLLWMYYEIRRSRSRRRLQEEREQATARARLERDRLDRLAEAAEAERLEEERREAERVEAAREAARLAEEARRLPPPEPPRRSDRTETFPGRVNPDEDPPTNPGVLVPRVPRFTPLAPPEPSDPFGSRLIPPSAPGPRDPASGGPAHSPASRAAPPPAPSFSRPMPPPSVGRPTARPAEEEDMDIHAPPPPEPPRRRPPPVDDTGTGRRQADGGQPQGGWRNWPWYVWAGGAVILVALIGGGIWAYSNRGPSEQDLLVERAVQMQAEETLRTYMKTDPVMSKSCPNGWNDDCWRTLYAAKIELPPCVQVERSQVNTTGVSSLVAMDDRCRAEMVRQNGRRVKEAAARPTGEVRQFLENTEFSQRRAFQTGDTVRINALLEDPALKREVVMDFWMENNVPWRILAHPSLNQGDLTKVYGVVQANGWYEAMPWLVINPNLDPNLRGMWLTRPVADPTERERQILLGMHQPAVPAAVFSWLVDQAVDEYKEQGSLELWKALLKAGENGDLRVDKCHLPGEQDKDRKKYPLCEEGRTWDTVGQMEQAQAKDSTLPSPSIGWTELRYRCSFESFAGRHSRVAQASQEKVIRKLADASPPNLPPEP